MDPQWLVKEIGKRDLVVSDLAPYTTGIKLADTCRSMELAERSLEIALIVLKKQGHLLCKVFEGEDLKTLRRKFDRCFDQTRLVRPSAVRKGSKEIYVLGLGLKA